jgi:signal transduction histidine kinase/CheY-like chemotaxis protein
MAVGIVVSSGWFVSVPIVASVFPGLATMKINTALALTLGGLGLYLRVRVDRPWSSSVADGCGLLIALVAGLTLVQYVAGVNLGIDELILRDVISPAGAGVPGRMGSNVAACLLMVGIALVLLNRPFGRRRMVADALAGTAAWVAMMALLGYAYSVQSDEGFGSYTLMALHTSISLVVLSIGLLAMPPHDGLVALVTGDRVGSALGRRLLPVAIAVPFVLGWLELVGEDAGFYGVEMGAAIAAAGIMIFFGLFVSITVVSLNASDARRRHAEEALRAREERTDFALRAGGVGIWDADPSAGTMSWSDTFGAFHGLPPGATGTFEAFLACIHPDDRAATRAAIDTLSAATTSRLEYRTVWPDGSVHWIVGQGRHVQAVGSHRVVGIGMDVTERKQLESQLSQAQKMEAIGQLAGGVAHDFNNLLTAILGYASMLAERPDCDESSRRDLDEIRRAAERATALTRQLLAFSRRQILQARVLDLNTVVLNTVEMLRRLVGEDINLKLDLEPAALTVKADPTQLEQILLNLVVNARDAMPDGGMITVESRREPLPADFEKDGGAMPSASGRYAMLGVRDTGIGMDDATKRRIFEPFFTTKAYGKGTGLGLATVYGIVKQSGGFVWVYSEPGQGTAFKVYFPCMESRTVESADPPRPADTPGGTETLLLVEDEASVRTLARILLERSGYRVLEAPDAAVAEQMADHERGTIHLLVTDVVMPGAGGPDLFKRLHASRPALKVVYMSGYADEAVVRRGVLDAGVAFIQKPFSAQTICSKVREVLDAPEPATFSPSPPPDIRR